MPVIFITADDQAATRDETTRTAAAGSFAKPFDSRSLIAAITQASTLILLFVFAPFATAQEVSVAAARPPFGTRGKDEVNTGANQLGFRCVKSVQQVAAK